MKKLEINRRSLITGLISLVAAPAIVRVSSIMPIKQMLPAEALDLSVCFSDAQILSRGTYYGSTWIKGADLRAGHRLSIHGCAFEVKSVETSDSGWHHIVFENLST